MQLGDWKMIICELCGQEVEELVQATYFDGRLLRLCRNCAEREERKGKVLNWY